MKRKFIWEKWHNPIEEELNSYKSFLSPEEADEDIEEFDEEDMISHTVINKIPLNIIVALQEQNRVLESFDFWILHTNFDVTEDVKEAIEKSPGVESLDILTRYRVRIGFTISGAFNNSEVRQDIQRRLLKPVISEEQEPESSAMYRAFDEETYETIESKKNELNKNEKHWIMYVLPNGNMSIYSSKTTDIEFIEQLTFLNQMQLLVGGEIYVSKV